MTRFERLEKSILLFLIAALLSGIAISALRKARPPLAVNIGKFNTEEYKTAREDIGLPVDRVDINTADAEDLMSVKGIGKTIAERMIEYRYNNGSFASVDDIKNVKGVGVALFEKIRDRIKAE